MTRVATIFALLGFVLLPLAADINADLRSAVERRDAARVRELLRAGAAADAADSSGRTPLMLAARAGSSELVRVLLASKAGPDAADTAGWTALMYAAAYGSRAVVEDLLAAGANPRLRENLGKTAEELAGQRDQQAVAAVLRQRREADDNRAAERLRGGFDALPASELDRLIAEGTPEVRGKVLDAALAEERADVVRRVLERGDRLDLDSPRRIGAATAAPVAWYALKGDAETLRLLLQAGAAPGAAYQGKPALVLAVEAGQEATAGLLIDRGAAPSPDALAAAIRARQPATAGLLLRRGAPLDARAVIAAVDADNGEFIDALAAGRIRAEQTGDALERAVASGHLQAARALVRNGLTTQGGPHVGLCPGRRRQLPRPREAPPQGGDGRVGPGPGDDRRRFLSQHRRRALPARRGRVRERARRREEGAAHRADARGAPAGRGDRGRPRRRGRRRRRRGRGGQRRPLVRAAGERRTAGISGTR